MDSWKRPLNLEEQSESSSMSLNNSIRENQSLNLELHNISIYQTNLNEKKTMSLKNPKCLDDLSSNLRKYATMKDKNSKFIGKHSFKRRLQKDTSRRHEGDRASRIAKSRRSSNKGKTKSVEGGLPRKSTNKNILVLQDAVENPRDFWNFTNKLNCIRNENEDDITLNSNIDDKKNVEDVKGEMVSNKILFYFI